MRTTSSSSSSNSSSSSFNHHNHPHPAGSRSRSPKHKQQDVEDDEGHDDDDMVVGKAPAGLNGLVGIGGGGGPGAAGNGPKPPSVVASGLSKRKPTSHGSSMTSTRGCFPWQQEPHCEPTSQTPSTVTPCASPRNLPARPALGNVSSNPANPPRTTSNDGARPKPSWSCCARNSCGRPRPPCSLPATTAGPA